MKTRRAAGRESSELFYAITNGFNGIAKPPPFLQEPSERQKEFLYSPFHCLAAAIRQARRQNLPEVLSLSQTHINAEEFSLIGSIKFFQGNCTEKQRISCNRSHPQLQVHFYVLLILTQSAFPNGFCQLEGGVNFCYQSFHLSYHGKLFD